MKSTQLGCTLSAIGAAIFAGAFMIGFGRTMAPNGEGEGIYVAGMGLGGLLMLIGLIALLTGRK